MSTANDAYGDANKDSQQIESEIARTRAEMSETLDALQERFSAGQLMDEIMDYIGGGPGDFAVNLAATVRGNPVPVGLVGAGLAWLMVSRGRGGGAAALARPREAEINAAGSYDPYYGEPYGGEPYGGEPYDDDPDRQEGAAGAAMRRAGESMERVRDSAAGAAGRIRDAAAGAGEQLRGTAGRTGAWLGGAAGGARDRLGGLGSGIGETVRENPLPIALMGAGLGWLLVARGRGHGDEGPGARPLSAAPAEHGSGMAERARGSAGRAGDQMRETTGRARERLSGMASGVGGAAGQVRDTTYRQARRAGAGVGHFANEQPLVLAGIGLALGAMIGAVLPRSRREDELMGGTRDDMVQRAGALGKEKLRGAAHVVEAAADAARAEADRQGLSVEGGKETMRDMKDKVESVAAAARDTARTEAEKEGLTPSSKRGKREGS